MRPIFFPLEVNGENRQICLVDFPCGWGPEELADFLVARYSDNLERTDLVILRPPVDTPITDSYAVSNYQDAIDSLSRRTPRASGHILRSRNFRHYLSRNLVKGRRAYSPQILQARLDEIQEQELQYYVNNSDALLSARSGFVYRAPSGDYVRQFLRVGNIQKSRQALDAFFFWMLPFLKNCSTIVVDTWSISSIALNAARLIERYRGKMRCRVEMLPTYFDGGDNSRVETELLLRHAWQRDCSILVLFSAVRSGQSLVRLRDFLMGIVPQGEIQYVALYQLLDSETPAKAMCSGLRGFDTVSRTGTVIAIDSGSFFPMTVRDNPLMIRKVECDPNRQFFRYYKGLGAVRIHRDVHDSQGQQLRHHAFDIDVESLFTKKRFRDRFRNKLRNLQPPSIIVVPSHDAGIKLGNEAVKVVSENIGRTPILINHPDLDPQDRSLTLDLSGTDSHTEILIIDDVSTTGQRLSRFQANLRARNFRGHITYLVGVARPDNEQEWSDRIKNLSPGERGRQNDVEYVEKIVLPNWGEDECPWCIEYSWLSEILRSGNLSDITRKIALERQQLLQSSADSEGLVSKVLWIPSEQPRPTITRGSFFLPHLRAAEADVVASVAGAIQRMRTSKEANRLSSDYPQPRILSPKNYLGPSPRYNDLILRMAVLRSARSSELVRWDDGDEKERSKYFWEGMTDNQGCFPLELIVALAQGKFPLIDDSNDSLRDIQSDEIRQILMRAVKRQ